MDQIYFKLNTGIDSFVDQPLGIELQTGIKTAYSLELNNISTNVYENLIEGNIVQIDLAEYNSIFQDENPPANTTPIHEETTDLSPYNPAKSPQSSLPSNMVAGTYYLLNKTPKSPFESYPDCLVEFSDNTFHIYKPEVGDIAIISISPDNVYYKYEELDWPLGKWVLYTNGVGANEGDKNKTVIIQKTGEEFTNLDFDNLDISNQGKIAVTDTVIDVAILREGTPLILGEGYTLSSNKKIVTFTSTVQPFERVIIFVILKVI